MLLRVAFKQEIRLLRIATARHRGKQTWHHTVISPLQCAKRPIRQPPTMLNNHTWDQHMNPHKENKRALTKMVLFQDNKVPSVLQERAATHCAIPDKGHMPFVRPSRLGVTTPSSRS